MILGVDFDNTLVCYDDLFHAEAVARRMMPEDGPREKREVRDWLIQRGREDDFTRLQGIVYGSGIHNAPLYRGALECLSTVIENGGVIFIVSHKTKQPVLGPAYDLRKAAMDWLEAKGFFSRRIVGREQVFFEDTMAAKAARIGALGCTHFIDDMKRFLDRDDFPAGTTKLWFRAKEKSEKSDSECIGFSSWSQIAAWLRKATPGG